MASYLGPNNIPQISDYQGSVPLDLLGRAGMMRQGEYNQNQASLQALPDSLAKYPIIKDSDRAVINQKIGDLTSSINKYSGQDLGNPRVYNSVMGAASAAASDPEMMSRISANQSAIKQLKTIQDVKNNDPDHYSPDNEHVFNKQLNQWLSNPNQTSFNATYTPYYDYSDEVGDIIDRVKDDPDVKNGLATNADGSKRPYTQQEIEQVTAAKLKLALRSSLSSKATDQIGIEYQAGMDSPQYSLPNTLDELDNHIGYLGHSISELKAFLPHATNKSEYDQAQKMIASSQADLDDYQDKRDKVSQSGDPSIYHTYSKYLGDKLDSMGNAYQYRKEGKVGYDEKFMEDYKQRGRLALAKFKLDHAHQIDTEPGAVNTTEEGFKGLAVNGEAEFKPSDVYAMQNFGGKIKADGSMDVPLGDKEQVLDLKPMLDAIPGMKVSAEKALGVGPIVNDFGKWQNTKEGRIYVTHHNPDVTQSSGMMGTTSTGMNQEVTTSTPKSFDDYLQFLTSTDEGKKYIANTYKKTGIDMTKPGDIDAAKALAKSPELIQNIMAASTIMDKNKMRGIVNVIPQPGTNTIVTSTGDVHNKFYTQVSEDELKSTYGNPDKYVDAHIFNKVAAINHDEDNKTTGYKGKQMYQIPITLKSTRPESEVMADVINRDPIMKQHAGVYMEHAYNTLNLKNFAKASGPNDIDVTKVNPNTAQQMAVIQTNALLQTGKITPQMAQSLLGSNGNGSDGKIGMHIAGLGGNNSTKLTNAAYLKAIITAQDGEDLIKKIHAVTKWSAPLNVTTKPTNNASIESED